MTARQQRRHEERITRKAAHKAPQKPGAAAAPSESVAVAASRDREPKTPGRSTGPRTPEGKAISSMNNLRHGLAGNFAVLDWEDSERYGELLFQLHQEHQPETMSEYILVERMAQHQWLSQRAVLLQNLCFRPEAPLCDQEQQLALYLRYGTTHDRAFSKCLADLLKLRAQKSKDQREFESQKLKVAAETRKQELHEAKLHATQAKKVPSPSPLAVPAAPAIAFHPITPGFVPQNHPPTSEESACCYVGK